MQLSSHPLIILPSRVCLQAEERLKVLEKTKSAAQRRNAEANRSRTLPNARGSKFNQTAGPRTSTSLATSFSISKPRTAAKARAGGHRGGTRIRGSTRSLADNSRQQAKLSSMLRQLDDNNRQQLEQWKIAGKDI